MFDVFPETEDTVDVQQLSKKEKRKLKKKVLLPSIYKLVVVME